MENNKEVMSRLKFIGRIQKGEKINVRHMFVQPDSFLTSISRTVIHPDNKTNTLGFVQSTINRAFEIIEHSFCSGKNYQKEMCRHLVRDLNVAKNGMKNLKETYIADVKFCCDMDTMLQDIEAKISSLSKETDLLPFPKYKLQFICLLNTLFKCC